MGEVVKVKFKRINVISFALFQTIFSAILGIVLGIIEFVVYEIIKSSAAIVPTPGINGFAISSGGSGLLGFGIGFLLILTPIVLAILGFLIGIIVAAIINLTLKIIGGLKMVLEEQD